MQVVYHSKPVRNAPVKTYYALDAVFNRHIGQKQFVMPDNVCCYNAREHVAYQKNVDLKHNLSLIIDPEI